MDPVLIDYINMACHCPLSSPSRSLSMADSPVGRRHRRHLCSRTDQLLAKSEFVSKPDQSLQSSHTKLSPSTEGQLDLTSALHVHAHNLSSTSAQSSLNRLLQSPNASSDLTKSSLIPRFSFTKRSMFLLSCLLLVIGNSVPIASSARPPLTSAAINRNQVGDGSSLLSQGTVVSFNRRSEPETDRDNNGVFGPLVPIESKAHPNEMKCLFYNRTQCEKTRTGCGETYQVCHSQNSERNSSPLCYALWHMPPNSTQPKVDLQGCWLGQSKDCISKENVGDNGLCVLSQSHKSNRKLFFCCCTGEMCNNNVTIGQTTADTTISPPLDADLLASSDGSRYPKSVVTNYIMTVLGIIFILGIGTGAVFAFHKWRKKPNSSDMPTSEPLLDGCNSGTGGYIGLNPVKLKEIRAQGKFGSVWQATDGRDNMVAVKVFNLQDRSSWQIEKDVYSLPRMKHDNILSYLGAERQGEGLTVEYWLITEYHPNGSLFDYLKSHTVNYQQLLTIIQGIGRGLTHLHEELPSTATEGAKPSVAHRDFKSKNVLLSTNFRACIADFGLAIVFHPNTLGDAHGQVGTRRYMAPEVLEGAINFNRDSFLRIDMYACGLVLWELMSRCNVGDITASDYRLPFEDEVGTHPTLEDMQEVVSQQKKRPTMADAWSKHKDMALIAQTVQDCWDQDAEARISASTICERMMSLILKEDNSGLTVNNHTNTASYRVPTFGASNAVPNAASNATSKNSFLMTAQATNGQIPNGNSNGGSAYILRETST